MGNLTVQEQRMKLLVYQASGSTLPFQVSQTPDSFLLCHRRRENKAWKTNIFYSSSASHISQARPAGVQTWLRLEECVQWRLDRAAHTDSMQTTGIHQVSRHPLGMNEKDVVHRTNVMNDFFDLEWSLSFFCVNSKPRSSNVAVKSLTSSLTTGSFAAIKPGTGKTPIHMATADRWGNQMENQKALYIMTHHYIIADCCTGLRYLKTKCKSVDFSG